jgi:hypothetical protein
MLGALRRRQLMLATRLIRPREALVPARRRLAHRVCATTSTGCRLGTLYVVSVQLPYLTQVYQRLWPAARHQGSPVAATATAALRGLPSSAQRRWPSSRLQVGRFAHTELCPPLTPPPGAVLRVLLLAALVATMLLLILLATASAATLPRAGPCPARRAALLLATTSRRRTVVAVMSRMAVARALTLGAPHELVSFRQEAVPVPEKRTSARLSVPARVAEAEAKSPTCLATNSQLCLLLAVDPSVMLVLYPAGAA